MQSLAPNKLTQSLWAAYLVWTGTVVGMAVGLLWEIISPHGDPVDPTPWYVFLVLYAWTVWALGTGCGILGIAGAGWRLTKKPSSGWQVADLNT